MQIVGILLLQSNSYISLYDRYFTWSKIRFLIPVNFCSALIFVFVILPFNPIYSLNWMFYFTGFIYCIVISLRPVVTKQSFYPIILITIGLVLIRLFVELEKQAELFALFGISCVSELIVRSRAWKRKSEGFKPPLQL